MKKNLLLFIFALCFVMMSTGLATAQDIVSGVVKDDVGTLPGVSIQIKGTTQGTISDVNGKFSLKVPDMKSTTLVFSFVGYDAQEVAVLGKTTLDVTLVQSATKLDEFVVVGYGVQRKTDLTGAAKRLSSDQLGKSVATSPIEMMQGRVTGVNIAQNNGEPGAGMTVRVRGNNSIRSGMDPLYVIDGVPLDNPNLTPNGGSAAGISGSASKNPISFLNPEDIASIDVLKDASSTAIYGSRAANGVIMITTKKGDQGVGKLSYDGYAGFSQIRKKLDIVSADQWRTYLTPAGKKLPDSLASTNWQDQIFQSAFTQSHSLSYGGGTKNHTYRASIGYIDQEGIIKTTDMKKVNGKLAVTQKAFHDKLELTASIIASQVKDKRAPIGETGGFEGDVILNSLKLNPTYPVYNKDGSYFQKSPTERNPVAMLDLTDDITTTNQVIANMTAEYEIVKNLKYKVNVGYTNSSAERRINQDQKLNYLQNKGEADINAIVANSTLIENYLTYLKNIGTNHQFNFLLGYAYQHFNTSGRNLNVKGFVVNDVKYTNNPAFGNLPLAVQSFYASTNELQSYFGRVNYSFMQKYLMTFTLRNDGSTRFGQNKQSQWFPSAALAWRLSDEDFIKSLDVFSNLKLRLGYGMTGNQEIPNKISQEALTVDPSGAGFFNGTLTPGIVYKRVPNPNIQWETTIQTDLGLDLGFFKNRLTATIDVFHKLTKDMLVEIPAAQPSPVSTVWTNLTDGEIINNGVEVGIEGIIITQNDFTWDAGFNVSYIKNTVQNLPFTSIYTGVASGPGLTGTYVQIITNDQPLGTFYGYVFEGFDASGKSIYKKDASGVEVKENLGSAIAKYNFSFNTKLTYKDFDFSMFWYGVAGNKVYNNQANAIFTKGSLNTGSNVTTAVFNSSEDVANSNAFSSRFIENGSFFRLANLTLGYTINTKSVKWIDKARVYATGNNLLLLTKYTGFDPEVNNNASQNGVPSMGIDFTAYPKARTFTVGVNLNF